MSWTSWIAPVLSTAAQVGTSLYGMNQASRAADVQAQAAQQGQQVTQQGINLARDMFLQGRADMAPFRAAGTGAMNALVGEVGGPWGPGNPGYDFQMEEGVNALDRSAASRGMLNSGGHQRALMRYGHGLAAQGRGDHLNRLAAMAGVGQTATGQGVQAGQGFAGQVMGGNNALAGLMGQGAAAQASGMHGQYQALAGGVNNLLAQWGR